MIKCMTKAEVGEVGRERVYREVESITKSQVGERGREVVDRKVIYSGAFCYHVT